MVEGGMKCVKYILFAFNLVFFLAGLGLIITGAVVQTRFSTYFDFFGSSFSAVAIIFIVVGSIIFIIGFFGCCGAYKENYCMTMTFAVLLGIIFLMEIAVAIAAYVLREELGDFIADHLHEAEKNYNKGNDGVTETWDVMQHDIKCCGVANYTDWGDSVANVTQGSVPDSCCIIETPGCGKDVLADPDVIPTTIYTAGCMDAFEDWVKANIYIIGGVGIGLAFVQMIGICLACCLARTIKREYDVV